MLDNATGDDIAIAFDPTVLRWDDSRWELQPCTNADVSDPATGLCGVKNINAQILGPGRHTSADDGRLTFFWPAGVEIPPGTYALVLPMARERG